MHIISFLIVSILSHIILPISMQTCNQKNVRQNRNSGEHCVRRKGISTYFLVVWCFASFLDPHCDLP